MNEAEELRDWLLRGDNAQQSSQEKIARMWEIASRQYGVTHPASSDPSTPPA